jgi:putative membrane protein
MLWAVLGAAFEWLFVWGWHVPILHERAALDPAVFRVQQASFLAAGMAVWLPGVAGRGRRAAAAGLLGTALAAMHMTMLGVLLATSPGLLYPAGLCGGFLGLDALEDQRLGGVLMALGGGLPYIAGAILFAYHLLRDDGPALQ